jgi:hypothetical protein
LILLAMLAASLAWPSLAAARPRVDWADVAVREGDDAKRLGKELQGFLKKASKRADWGKRGGKVRLAARVARFEWLDGEEVLRLEVTVVGRVQGGPEVRSRIRVGGRPGDRKKLEKEGLRIVAEGLVTRLADIVRRRDS